MLQVSYFLLSFHTHVRHLWQSVFLHLRNKLWPFLSLCDAEKLAHTFAFHSSSGSLAEASKSSKQCRQDPDEGEERNPSHRSSGHFIGIPSTSVLNTDSVYLPTSVSMETNFKAATPWLWNTLPENLRAPQTVDFSVQRNMLFSFNVYLMLVFVQHVEISLQM